MPEYPITPKQDVFAHVYVESGNASLAYRTAYDAENMLPQTVWTEASLLLDNPKVARRVNELKTAAIAPTDVSAAEIVRIAYEIASNGEQPTAARVSALALLAKRHPEFSDKHDVSVNTRTKALIAVSEMPLEQLLALAEGIESEEA